MPAKIYSVDYYYTTVVDQPGQGCRFLEFLASEQVNLLAFNAFPLAGGKTQLIIYPLNTTWLAEVARKKHFELNGPHHALMVNGDDELGALVEIHQKLCDHEINVASSSGLTDGRGGYRYLMHVGPEDYDKALEVLDVDTGLQHRPDGDLKVFRRFESPSGSAVEPLKTRRRKGAL